MQSTRELNHLPLENVYNAEKILAVRQNGNKIEYYVKWYGFPCSDNTWEPPEHFLTDDLIREFELERSKTKCRQVGRRKKIKNKIDPLPTENIENENKMNFEREATKKGYTDGDWEVEEILGATDEAGIQFLVRWINKVTYQFKKSFIPNEVARKHMPLKVIEFYSRHSRFIDD